jgi:hypothetical protein
MNRSILIVICDFLLVSLLAFSTVDINKVTDEGTPRNMKVDLAMSTNRVDSGKDLTAVMRLALEDERRNRDQLLGELTRARETAGEREKQAEVFQQELRSKEQEAQRMQGQQTTLAQQLASAQTNIQTLSQRLQGTSSEATLSKEKLAELEAQLKKKAEEEAALKEQLAQLAKNHEAALAEQLRLNGQLQVAEAEKRAATEHATRMEQEVKVEREEKAKLAEGVKTLASKSDKLAQEIRENRALAPNLIYSEFLSNRVQASLTAVRQSLLGSAHTRDTETVLVTDGTNYFALCHVQDTPLSLWNPGTDWDGLTGTLSHNSVQVTIRSLSFHLHDPRVVMMPLSAAEAHELGCKIYDISQDPFKFQDAVLVGTRDSYYGECKFEIDLNTHGYVKLDNSFIKGLFGKFNPSRGDLVFSKNNELLGVMANSTYCLMIHSFDSAAAFHLATDVRDQHTSVTLSLLYARVMDMPFRLQ